MKAGRAMAAAALVLSVTSTAAATVMVRASVEALAAESEHVALGTVASVEPVDGGPRGERGIFTRVVLSVDETWRGAPTDALVFWVHGGRLGDRAMRTHGQAVFIEGERVVVFLDDAGGALFPTAMSQGKWLVEGGLARSGAAPDALERDRGLAPVAPLAPVPLDALEARVRSAR